MRFFYSLFLSFFLFFFSFAFLVWKFDVLFVGLLVVDVFYGHSKQTRSLLLLDLYYSAWRAICDSYHRFFSTARESFSRYVTAEVKVSFRPIH